MTERSVATIRHLGGAIHDARKAAGLTQADLAREAGVSREWLIGIERGARPGAEIGKIFAVLNALDVELSVSVPQAERPAKQSPKVAQRSEKPLVEALAAVNRINEPTISPPLKDIARKAIPKTSYPTSQTLQDLGTHTTSSVVSSITQQAVRDMRQPAANHVIETRSTDEP